MFYILVTSVIWIELVEMCMKQISAIPDMKFEKTGRCEEPSGKIKETWIRVPLEYLEV